MKLFTVVYNGIACKDVGLKAVRRPDIPTPAKRMTKITIPGRSGNLHIDEGAYEPIEISVEFNFISRSEDWGITLREIRKWLHGSKDKRLFLSDDGYHYYKVNYVAADEETERKVKRIGRLTAIFVCDPYMYEIAGDHEIQLPCKLYNTGEESMPLYRIAGEGMCTLAVNGKSVTANVGQELMIDTDLMIAYRAGTVQNTAITGDYENLRLKPGQNTLEITDGFEAAVTPRWRHV